MNGAGLPARFSVLASGSSGNASLLQVGEFGLLIDAGLSPRRFAERLAAVGANWYSVKAVLLTHTHGDHWNSRTLGLLRRQRIPLYCHPWHALHLEQWGRAFGRLRREDLVRHYTPGETWEIADGICCKPFPIPHDGGVTFGFRLAGPHWSLAYAADLGCWTTELAAELADVDILCLEFNHDVEMERASGRPVELIERVLGDHGHLSNDQAGALLASVVRLSTPGRLRHLVQLHLSRECNQPQLALSSARAVLKDESKRVRIHTAYSSQAGPVIMLDHPSPLRTIPAAANLPQWLPGWEC